MKKFKIKDGCIACGLCSSMCDLFKSDALGKAYVESGHLIDNTVNCKEIVEICPVNVIEVINASKTTRKGKQGLQDLKQMLKKELDKIPLKEAKKSDIPFDYNEYQLSFGYCRSSSSYDYSSYSSAERAGLSEFSKVYNQYEGLYHGVVSQYKNNYLRPYYMLDETSFYSQNNQKYEMVLKDFVNELKELAGEYANLLVDFEKFDVYPGDRLFLGKMEKRNSDRKSSVDCLANIDQWISGIEVSKQPYGKDCYSVDVDDTEVYIGDGLFGNMKFKTKYRYYRVDKTVEEYKKDVIGHFKSFGYEIASEAFAYYQNAIRDYNNAIKDEIEFKLKQLDELINKL